MILIVCIVSFCFILVCLLFLSNRNSAFDFLFLKENVEIFLFFFFFSFLLVMRFCPVLLLIANLHIQNEDLISLVYDWQVYVGGCNFCFPLFLL